MLFLKVLRKAFFRKEDILGATAEVVSGQKVYKVRVLVNGTVAIRAISGGMREEATRPIIADRMPVSSRCKVLKFTSACLAPNRPVIVPWVK